MRKYSNILLCTDLDGTMLGSDGKLSDKNRKAIDTFMAEDGKFCVATGRLPGHLLQFFDKNEFNCPVICCNGACIYDFKNDKILHECTLGDDIDDVIRYASQYAEDIVKIHYFDGFKNCEEYDITGNPDRLIDKLKGHVYKAVLTMKNEESALVLRDKLKELYGDTYNFSRSWNVGLEILNKKTTKGRTVKRLQELLGGDRVIVAVGDYENDISMIEAADIGCAVGNAVDELKTIADRVICTNNENAIAYIADNILSWI